MVDEFVQTVEIRGAESTTEVLSLARNLAFRPSELPACVVFTIPTMGDGLLLTTADATAFLVAAGEDMFATAVLNDVLLKVIRPGKILLAPGTPPCPRRELRGGVIVLLRSGGGGCRAA